MPSLTLHNLDAVIMKQIKEQAEINNTSMNKTIQRILENALGVSKKRTARTNFSDLAGTWSQEEADEFELHSKDLSKIDPDMWQ